MPFKSQQQRKAMYAAASGHSNIGIPKSVGEKFVKHKDDNDLDWLDELLLKEMEVNLLKGDAIPAESTVLSTPEVKEDNITVRTGSLSNDLKKLQIRDMGDKLRQIAQHISSIKKDETIVKLGNEDCKVPENDCKEDAENIDLVPVSPVDVKPEANDAGAQGRAAGIMFITPDEEVLMIRRGAGGGDYPSTWCVPGGHQKGDESLEETARRECKEETGIDYTGDLEVLFDDGQFRYYVARDFAKEPVTLNYESTGSDWCNPTIPPLPLHPGIETAFKVALAKTETDVAKLMSQGILASPQMYANIGLFAIRITGTGLAYRSSIKENVWRDPSLYLNEQFLERCNGLAVIMDHPDTQVLTTEEFKNRAVGSIMLPYIQEDEVWGIAKIYDQEAIKEICEGEISTSPAVVFDNTAGNITLTTENGEPLLIEGVPFLLDHIAIVTKARGSKGVWDKGGDATGVLLTNNEVSEND